MIVETTPIPGLLLIKPKVFRDNRGYFLENWNAERYREAGMNLPFVQDNLSFSLHGIIRGLHFQNPRPQGKLVSVLHGSVFDVAVDLRRGSPSFGRWFGATLTDADHQQLYIPPGFAHGFCSLSQSAVFAYKCTDVYVPAGDRCLRYDDPDIGIDWPLDVSPQLSEKDANAPRLRELPEDVFLAYEP